MTVPRVKQLNTLDVSVMTRLNLEIHGQFFMSSIYLKAVKMK